MPNSLYLKDGRLETIFEVTHFEDLVREYMGDDAAQYFRELVADHEQETAELKEGKAEIADYVLKVLLPTIAVTDDGEREEWAENFRAKMEDVYGFEE